MINDKKKKEKTSCEILFYDKKDVTKLHKSVERLKFISLLCQK